ncbi:hypothetical protein KFL_001920110 [Klebsormidium nitens]|uniref:Uncharacterized protein n=1 Tax=Klebsormidium nitens TaxID=105231 RepID=A0A1Y1I0P3_KLENI|nr:hypothetical protein KFL_001920110 [Klebsormidium nitens]|eukprot:GAQ84510.1 hypothetical protein KFL_001920110 [Klebsormidium nitens]
MDVISTKVESRTDKFDERLDAVREDVFAQELTAQTLGSSSGPVLSRLTLPAPYLVNSFLMNNATNLFNPLFGAEGPRPLQVIKCQPKLRSTKKSVGPAYEFYQVQAPDTACNFPPPVETVVHHHHVGSFKYWASFIAVYVSLSFLLLSTVILGVPFAAGTFLENRWKASPPEEPSAPDLEAPASEPQAAPQEAAGGDPFAEPDYESEMEADAEERVKSMASREHASNLITSYDMLSLIFILVATAFTTSAAMKEMFPKTTIQRLGPVALPDPSQGLNQFLKEMDGSLSLELCKTPKMSFYVGFPDNCERLGDPYGGIEAPAKTGPSKSKRFLLVWLTKLGSLHLYLAAFWVVILSVAGNVALVLLFLGTCEADQLKEVASALRVELIERKGEIETEMGKRPIRISGELCQ